MIRIGPSFAKEIEDAGLAGLPFTWGEDGVIEFRDDVPQATRDAVAAVLAAHDPNAPAPPIHTDLSDLLLVAVGNATEIADAKSRIRERLGR